MRIDRKLVKIGNGLAIRVPKIVADFYGWTEGTELTLDVAKRSGMKVVRKEKPHAS